MTDKAGQSLSHWSGSPCSVDPDNYWIDDETGERVSAETGKRFVAMHRTTPKEEHLLASLKAAIAAFDISLVKEIEAIIADELDHRANEMRETVS